MAQLETLGILEDVEALVSDKLQVVSYKWLSRNYLVSSNTAKRLLQEFVEKHDSGLKVVYTLAGWLKTAPPSYHIRLVSGPKLAEAKQFFERSYSVQVYSVQASIPKDSAALWNTEFIQAEELFKQPSTVENCLRDNRFCGISNPFVKRNPEGIPVSITAPQPKSTGGIGISKNNFVHQNATVPKPQESEQKSGPNVGPQSSIMKEVKRERNGTGFHPEASKPPAEKEKVISLPAGKKKVPTDKNSSGTGGSLANLWGCATAKSKASVPSEASSTILNPIVSSGETQISAREAIEGVSSDDDGEDVNFKRVSNGEGSRKRRVIFDFSDDDESEDAVNLASPDNPKAKLCQDPSRSAKVLVPEKADSKPDKRVDDKPKAKGDRVSDKESKPDKQVDDKPKAKGDRVSDKESNQPSNEDCPPENDSNKRDKPTNNAPTSPKRRKVLKTRIDERGREVTEVIREGEATDVNKDDAPVMKKADHSTVNRLAAANKKSPAVGNNVPNPTGKAGGTKKLGISKDPKQGNILSFFKKVLGSVVDVTVLPEG